MAEKFLQKKNWGSTCVFRQNLLGEGFLPLKASCPLLLMRRGLLRVSNPWGTLYGVTRLMKLKKATAYGHTLKKVLSDERQKISELADQYKRETRGVKDTSVRGKIRELTGMKKGGSVSSASKRADGIAVRGKTKGRMV